VMPYTWLRRIDEGSVVTYNIPTGEERELKADHVVLNTGRRQKNDLASLFRQNPSVEVLEIGDCSIAGGRIGGAIDSGFVAGSKI
jgi:hypothetical protein